MEKHKPLGVTSEYFAEVIALATVAGSLMRAGQTPSDAINEAELLIGAAFTRVLDHHQHEVFSSEALNCSMKTIKQRLAVYDERQVLKYLVAVVGADEAKRMLKLASKGERVFTFSIQNAMIDEQRKRKKEQQQRAKEGRSIKKASNHSEST